jgi:hypothetical protein
MDVGILKRGAIAGLVGALVIVLWFLAVDLVRGDLLGTPRFVAGALLGGPALAAVPAYTVLHFMTFLVVGAASSWAMDRLRVGAPTLIGAALGFLLFDLIFYGSVWATGADIVDELGWGPVLAGNLLAGLAMAHVLHRLQQPGRTGWLTTALRGTVIREGLWIGTVGAVVVALWFLLLDGLAGVPLRTPSALGGLVFAGETHGAELPVNMAWVWGYSAVHLAIGIVLGIVMAAASAAVDRSPPLVVATILAFVSFEAFMLGVVGLVSVFLPHGWFAVAVANLLAAGTMVTLIWFRHPVLAEALRSDTVLAGSP